MSGNLSGKMSGKTQKCRVKRKNVGEKLKKRRGKAGGNFLLFFYGGQLLNSSLVCQHAEFEDPLI